jgi:hypothetical protein
MTPKPPCSRRDTPLSILVSEEHHTTQAPTFPLSVTIHDRTTNLDSRDIVQIPRRSSLCTRILALNTIVVFPTSLAT